MLDAKFQKVGVFLSLMTFYHKISDVNVPKENLEKG